MRLIDADRIVAVAQHAYNEWNLAMATQDINQGVNRVLKMQELCKCVKAVADGCPTIATESLRPRWIPVSDRLPEKQKDVLIYFADGNAAVGFWHDQDENVTFWCAYTDGGYYTDCDSEPTHWMPLPELPGGGDADDL